MSSLGLLFLILILAIGFIIFSTSYLKIHPVLVLLSVALFVGVTTGIPSHKVVGIIAKGFGSLMGSIGLVVVLGCVLGILLERAGALQQISQLIIQLFGKKRPVTAIALLGAIVGIPVFCDSGFVILSNLGKKVARQAQKPAASTALGLAAGLYTTHNLVPPTPGPVAAAGNFAVGDNLGLVIIIGILVSIPTLLVAIWFATWVNRNTAIEEVDFKPEQEVSGGLSRSFPLILALLLICLSSLVSVIGTGESWFTATIAFIGHPVMALFIAVLVALLQFRKIPEMKSQESVAKGVEQAGPILVITGAGGSFGQVLKESDFANLIQATFTDGQFSGIALLFIAFGLAALLKTSQGSSTSAIVITSAMLAPFLASAGVDSTIGIALPKTPFFPSFSIEASAGVDSTIGIALVITAIGAGAMTVSHANDSFFWVVTRFSDFTVQQAYRQYTVMTLLKGLTGLAASVVLYLFLG